MNCTHRSFSSVAKDVERFRAFTLWFFFCIKINQTKIFTTTLNLKVANQGSYTFSGQNFKDFSRTFQNPTLKFQGLLHTNSPTAKQNVCVESYVLVMNRCTCKTPENENLKRRANRHSLCTSGSISMHETKSVFTHFVNNSRILYPVYLKICFRWLSFNLKLISIDISRSFSIKKSRTFKDHKPISSTFKALKFDCRNSRVFKGFQDAYEPWQIDKVWVEISLLFPTGRAITGAGSCL